MYSSSEEIKSIASEMQKIAEQNAPWYTDFNTVMTILIGYAVVCGVITLFIAVENRRSWFLGFISGVFLGQLGVVAYMIMGKSED